MLGSYLVLLLLLLAVLIVVVMMMYMTANIFVPIQYYFVFAVFSKSLRAIDNL